MRPACSYRKEQTGDVRSLKNGHAPVNEYMEGQILHERAFTCKQAHTVQDRYSKKRNNPVTKCEQGQCIKCKFLQKKTKWAVQNRIRRRGPECKGQDHPRLSQAQVPQSFTSMHRALVPSEHEPRESSKVSFASSSCSCIFYVSREQREQTEVLLESSSGPCMVYVLPLPVCPYAKMQPL